MVFYQYTTTSVTLEQITDSILKGSPTSSITDLHFLGHKDIHTLEESLTIIDHKREMLQNPYQHSFLVIEPCIPDSNTAVQSAFATAEALNTHFNNDLFIILLTYRDELDKSHSVVIINDIEISLPESTSERLSADTLFVIIKSSSPDSYIYDLTYDALYLFNSSDDPLPYDGVIHVKYFFKY